MSHSRDRFVFPKLLKRLKHFPVVAIQGARQTGKSFLAREILPTRLAQAQYVTLDGPQERSQALEQSQSFLERYGEKGLLIIDEAQKAPVLFDTIKLLVDRKRTPGRYLLLGSTEFSRLTKISESLTGRMGITRLYPLCLAESLGSHWKPGGASRRQLLEYLDTGGMPAIFSLRDHDSRQEGFEEWLNLTCSRDLLQFPRLNLDPELASALIRLSCTLEEPSAVAMAKALRRDARRVATHLKALTALFVLNPVLPHESGRGKKTLYFPLDCGIAHHHGASQLRRLQIWLLNERLCSTSYRDVKRKKFYTYHSQSRALIDLVELPPDGPPTAYKLHDREVIKKTDVEILRAFQAKNPESKTILLAPVPEAFKVNGVQVLPWELAALAPRSKKA